MEEGWKKLKIEPNGFPAGARPQKEDANIDDEEEDINENLKTSKIKPKDPLEPIKDCLT